MEMLLALKMERELTKDEILELYLNKIFFGNRAYGVVAAAEFYYGKPLDQLSLAEAATLAATPKFPSSANPIINPARNIAAAQLRAAAHARDAASSAPAQEAAARAEPSHASPHEPQDRAGRALRRRDGAQGDAGPLRRRVARPAASASTPRCDSSDQIAANVAVRKGLVEYDRRHGWRGAEAHVDLPAGEAEAATRARLRQYQFISGMPAAIVTAGRRRQRHRADARPASRSSLDAASSKWTGRTPGALLKRGDVVRLQAGTGEKAPASSS